MTGYDHADFDTAVLADLARVDWLVAGNWDRLHCPTESSPDTSEWRFDDVTFACGWHVDTAWIPGLFTRMGAPRCARCCDRTGYPRGTGSPKNDKACQPLLDTT